MPIFTNFTPYAVGELAGFDPEGAEFYSLIVKATFFWESDGTVNLAPKMQPLLEVDAYAGEPGLSSPIAESDYTPFKPRLDVLVCGSIALPAAVEQVDVTLEVGNRIRKTLRVFGDRVWIPGVVKTLSMTRPRPWKTMPINWERSFGGVDPDHPKYFEPRNPVGVGKRKSAKSLEGQRAPNFEDPRHLTQSWNDQPDPVGFGPVGRAWQPRIGFAGTYDEEWLEQHFPLPPPDFDPRYHNCAPEDQQLDGYLPGEEVRLQYMTTKGHDRFALPRFEVPVSFGDTPGNWTHETLTPDTIVVEPAEHRLTLVGRVCHFPEPDTVSMTSVLVGKPTRGIWRSLMGNKTYLDFGRSGWPGE